MHVHKIHRTLTDSHSKILLQCQFHQSFNMVKAWAEMVVLLVGVTAKSFLAFWGKDLFKASESLLPQTWPKARHLGEIP
jgi:hypothetical protein